MKTILGPVLGAILIAAAPASAAAAQAAAPAQADDAAKLIEAHAIVDTILPPAQRDKMMNDMLSNLMAPMRKSLPTESITDPGLRKIINDYFDLVLQQQRPLLRKHMPDVLAAMGVAYTHEFSLAELKEVHAFAQTPTGRHYLSRSTAIIGDPAVMKVNAEMMADAQALAATTATEFKAKVIAYLKAHPAVAAKINAESKGK